MSVASKVRAAPRVADALPWVVRARWKIRRTSDLDSLLAAHDFGPVVRASRRRSVESLRRGVDGALRLVGPREDHCVPRGLALFALLTRHGYSAVFVSGVRRVGPDLRGHAWVLVDGVAVEGPRGAVGLDAFAEQFRYAVVARRRCEARSQPLGGRPVTTAQSS